VSKNYAKAHVYVRDIIQPIPESFGAHGMHVYPRQVGKKAPRTSPSYFLRHYSFLHVVHLTASPLKKFTSCPMLKALLHLLFRCCILRRLNSKCAFHGMIHSLLYFPLFLLDLKKKRNVFYTSCYSKGCSLSSLEPHKLFILRPSWFCRTGNENVPSLKVPVIIPTAQHQYR